MANLADKVLNSLVLPPAQAAALREALTLGLADGCTRSSTETKCRALDRFAALVRIWRAIGHIRTGADELLQDVARIRSVLGCPPPPGPG